MRTLPTRRLPSPMARVVCRKRPRAPSDSHPESVSGPPSADDCTQVGPSAERQRSDLLMSSPDSLRGGSSRLAIWNTAARRGRRRLASTPSKEHMNKVGMTADGTSPARRCRHGSVRATPSSRRTMCSAIRFFGDAGQVAWAAEDAVLRLRLATMPRSSSTPMSRRLR